MNTSVKERPAKAPSRGLGKGLSALLSDSYSQSPLSTTQGTNEAPQGSIRELGLNEIQPGKFQPRDHFDQAALMELSDSVREHGVMQPILVRKTAPNKYEIIAGERRWRAATMAGLDKIPAIVREFDDKTALEVALIENVQREDLNPLEEAAGYQRLIAEFGYTQEHLAGSVHKSRSHIANLLRLLELPEEIRSMLTEGKLTMGHARAIASMPDAILMAEEIVRKGLNVRQTEKMVRLRKEPSAYRLRKEREAASPAPVQTAQPTPISQPSQASLASDENAGRDPDIMALEATLSENLGLKVRINDRGQAGDITVIYESLEQLDEILRRLGGSI